MPIVVPIVSDTSGLTRGLRGAGSNLAKFGKIAALAIGVGVTAELYKSVKAAAAAEKSTQALRGQLETLGKSDDVQRLQDQFTQLATTLGVDDEAASRAFTSILRLTGDSTKAMEGLNLALDLSANTGFADLEKNAMQVARAMNGNTRLFKQFGIVVDETTSKEEALAIVQGRVQGQAESFGSSATGSFQRFNEAVENLRENIGGPLVVALAAVAGKVAAFVNTFREQPTLDAKIRLVVGTIGNIAWQGIRSLYAWWDTQGRAELPARVILTPSGRQQFDTFFTGLEKDARALGVRMGRGAVGAFIGLFSEEGRAKLKTTASSFAESFTSAAKIFFRVTGTTLLQQLTAGMLEGAFGAMKEVGQALVDGIVSGFNDAVGGLSDGLKKVVNKVIARSGPTFKSGFAIIISDPIKEAVASARASLAGLGSSLGDMLSTITGKTSPEAKRAAQIRKQQKLDAAAREKKSLEDAVATAETDDERRKAQQDLDDFLLDQEADRLEQVVADRQEADSLSIDNLIDQFNRGLISAGEFSSQLDGIIGPNRGAELGGAFASAFAASLTALTSTITSIVAGTAGVQAPAGTEVAAAQSAQQQLYNDAIAQWNKDRAERLKVAEDGRRRPGSHLGKKISDRERGEINDIMKIWEGNNQKPQKSAFGLARGGILKQPTFVAGEAGREAVIPLESSSAMKILRDAIGGGGGSTVVYNLVVNAGLGTDPDNLSRTIVESIKRYEKRNGAVFQGPIVTTLANAAGKTSTASAATDFNRAKTLRSG